MNIPRYLLPASIAAAVHAALLLADPARRSPAHPAPEDKPAKNWTEVRFEPLPDLADEPDPADAAVREQNRGGEPRDSLSEPVVKPESGGFEMPVPAITPPPRPTGGETIPLGPPGDGTGGDGIWSGPAGPIDVAGLDRAPRVTVQIAPDYPFSLRQQGIEGTVWVTMTVGPDGAVRDAWVTKSSDREFEAATLRAVLRWRFEPGRQHGRPVSFRMSVPVNFTLSR